MVSENVSCLRTKRIDLARFVRRKGFACGVAWSGTGLGGSATPLILNWLLDTYGPHIALRIWAVVQVRSIPAYINHKS